MGSGLRCLFVVTACYLIILIATLAHISFLWLRFPGTMCGIAEVSRLVLLEIVKPVHTCARFPVSLSVVDSIVQVTQSIAPIR